MTKKKTEDQADEPIVFECINEVLHMLQQTLKAPKNQYNSFGKYKYRSAEDILQGVKPILPEGATLVCSDEVILVGDRYYIKATAILSWGGMRIEATGNAREPLSKKGTDEPQISGTASSYARKYALNGLFCIDDQKDADTDEYQNQQNNAPEEKPKQTILTSEEKREEWMKVLPEKFSSAETIDKLQEMRMNPTVSKMMKAMHDSKFEADRKAEEFIQKAYEERLLKLEDKEAEEMGSEA